MSHKGAGLDRSKSTVIGWREWVALPDLGIHSIKAKIDTGARTSALHATSINLLTVQGVELVEFRIPRVGAGRMRQCTAQLLDRRPIKNTSGKMEMRFIIRSLMVIAGRKWSIELSLADREAMSFNLILGRTALRGHRLVIDPGRSFVATSLPDESSRPAP